MTYARVGERVRFLISAYGTTVTSSGYGTFIGTGALYKDVPVLHVRADDGRLIVLLPADGDQIQGLGL
jgi:hypothetical protein